MGLIQIVNTVKQINMLGLGMDQVQIVRAKNRQYCQAWRLRNRKAYNAYQRKYYLKRKRALTKDK